METDGDQRNSKTSSQPSGDSERRWARFGKGMAGLIVILGATVTIWVSVASPPRIIVNAELSEFRIADPLAAQLDGLVSVGRRLRDPILREPSRLEDPESSSDFMRDALLDAVNLGPLLEHNFMWRLEVDNRGGREASVEIHIPRATVAMMSKEGVPTQELEAVGGGERFNLGTVRPGEEAVLWAWGRTFFPRSLERDPGLQVYVSDGWTRIRYHRSVGPFWYWVATRLLGTLAFSLTFMGFIVFVALIGMAILNPEQSSGASTSKQSDEKEM